MPSLSLRRLVIPNAFAILLGALLLADGLVTDGGETLNPLEIVPGAVFLAVGIWNLFMVYRQAQRSSEETSQKV